jgi:hypothetical protein
MRPIAHAEPLNKGCQAERKKSPSFKKCVRTDRGQLAKGAVIASGQTSPGLFAGR